MMRHTTGDRTDAPRASVRIHGDGDCRLAFAGLRLWNDADWGGMTSAEARRNGIQAGARTAVTLLPSQKLSPSSPGSPPLARPLFCFPGPSAPIPP